MSQPKKYEYIVPRSFRLRIELDIAEKGVNSQEAKSNGIPKPKDPHAAWISFGLGDLDENASYENQLANWNGTIIGPQNTPLGDRIYSLKIKCGPYYPDHPPTIHFITKVNMPGVDPNTGLVSGIIPKWTRNMTMYDYLSAIRTAMTNAAKLKQPGPDEVFSN